MSRPTPLTALVFAAGLLLGGALVGIARPAPTSVDGPVARATGIGGIFLRAEDPAALRAWYAEHLGIEAGSGGTQFLWRERGEDGALGRTVWSLFPAGTEYFGPGGQQCMVNYRVDDLDALLAALSAAGVEQVKPRESYPFGDFAWIEDAEGNRIELWEAAPEPETDPGPSSRP